MCQADYSVNIQFEIESPKGHVLKKRMNSMETDHIRMVIYVEGC